MFNLCLRLFFQAPRRLLVINNLVPGASSLFFDKSDFLRKKSDLSRKKRRSPGNGDEKLINNKTVEL